MRILNSELIYFMVKSTVKFAYQQRKSSKISFNVWISTHVLITQSCQQMQKINTKSNMADIFLFIKIFIGVPRVFFPRCRAKSERERANSDLFSWREQGHEFLFIFSRLSLKLHCCHVTLHDYGDDGCMTSLGVHRRCQRKVSCVISPAEKVPWDGEVDR